jgi:hypothetical protein
MKSTNHDSLWPILVGRVGSADGWASVSSVRLGDSVVFRDKRGALACDSTDSLDSVGAGTLQDSHRRYHAITIDQDHFEIDHRKWPV